MVILSELTYHFFIDVVARNNFYRLEMGEVESVGYVVEDLLGLDRQLC